VRRLELVLLLVGYGHVGQRYAALLDEVADSLGFVCRVGGIATRHHGSALHPDGLDPSRATALVRDDQSLDRLDPAPRERTGVTFVQAGLDLFAAEAAEGRLVVVETTLLDITAGEPAISHVRAALEGRAHVVTANKGPVAFAHRTLDALAESVDRLFLFEGVVMDGVPVFNLVRETMPAVRVQSFRGVVNTTSNYVIGAMEAGDEMAEAVAEMQAKGIAEADPSLDLEGWDAAAKAAALANVLLGGELTPRHVERQGIAHLTGRDVRDAVQQGRRLKLVAGGERDAGGTRAWVRVEALPAADPLAGLQGVENALYLQTDLLGEIGIVQRTGTLTQTAYALVSDLARISQRLRGM
jgi:homoserine dehydrogenase